MESAKLIHRVRPRPRCFVTTLRPGGELASLLARYLALEIPEVDFALEAGEAPAVVWLCGHEPGATYALRALRDSHPVSILIVTGRAPLALWSGEALAAGADHVCGLPLDLRELERVLHLAARGRASSSSAGIAR